jgi:enamine deaminase RidA (YjgF/YER057c/UK114 family)
MTTEERLEALGLTLPSTPPAVGNYVSAVLHSDLLYVSGHGPYRDGEYIYRGKVDSVVNVEDAQKAAALTILNALGSVRDVLGSLDRVDRIVKLFGMVNSDPDFGLQPKVIDGASNLLVEIFGEKGKHARSAVGLGALPMGISVEIEMIVAVKL